MPKKKHEIDLPELLSRAAHYRLRDRAKLIEADIIQGMLDYILKFDIADGIMSDTEQNEKYIAGINRQLTRLLKKTGFDNDIKEYLTNFDQLRDWTIDTQQHFNKLQVSKRLLNKTKRRSIDYVVSEMLGEGLHQTVGRELTRVLQENIYYGGGISDVIKELEKTLTTIEKGQDKKMGLLTSHVSTVGRDGLLQYQGNVNRVIIKEYDMNAIRYIGSIVNGTRPQCRKWLKYNKNGQKGVITLKQLAEEIEWAKKRGSGFIKTTTVDNFAKNRGGHGCRHTVIPVRV